MKATNTQIQEVLHPAVGMPIWNARETMGIKFEMGKEREKGRGEFGFWIFCSHWWLQKGKGTNFEDIVNSESTKEHIEERVKVLNGKKLLAVEYHEENYTTFFDFEDDLFLHIAPYGTDQKDQEQWMFFSPDQITTLSADGTLLQKPKDN